MTDLPKNDRLDRTKIEDGVRLILEGIGEDPRREGIADTPRRVADMYEEIFAGYGHDASEVVTVTRGGTGAAGITVLTEAVAIKETGPKETVDRFGEVYAFAPNFLAVRRDHRYESAIGMMITSY